ncbi:glycoside hydrolase family 79 protein [Daedaleopsis nitida]|nr:glycoside hydrolase family 79 protein [Daedaleopsis nitida]
MRPTSSRFWLAALILNLAGCSVSAVTVSIPIAAPNGSEPLSSTLVSFSLEQDRWPDWTGVDARNDFTYNALSNYAALTGKPPNIRVGANSEDHTTWSPTEPLVENLFPTPDAITPYPESTRITVGDTYYGLSRYLPSGTHMVWGVNLGGNNVTNAVNMAKAIIRSFDTPGVKESGIVLDRMEVGNEADLYSHNGLRPKNYTVQQYVREWTGIAGPVVEALGISGRNGSITLQGAAFANQGFTPRQIYNLSILESAPGGAISVISQHHYQAHFCNGGNFSLVSFMDKAYIRSNLSIFEADITATRAQGLQYILGETNSIACHGAPDVSNTAGSALWAIDYTLRAATLGIREAYFHEGVGFKYNFIQPVALNRSIIDNTPLDPPAPPQVYPSYYGGLVVNTFIGASGSSQISELNVNDTNVSGYAAFEEGRLVRAVFVNLHAWLKNSAGARPSVHIALNLTGADIGAFPGQRVVARRMALQHADDVGNLTWAGRSYETADALPRGGIAQEDGSLADGVAILASEAVLIDFLGPEDQPTGASATAQTPRDLTKTYIAAGVVSGAAVAFIGVVNCQSRKRIAVNAPIRTRGQ